MKNRVVTFFSHLLRSVEQKTMLVFVKVRALKHPFTEFFINYGIIKKQINFDYSDIYGPIGEQDLFWIFQQVSEYPESINIVEINPGEGQVTCYLGKGCLGTKKRVYTIWVYNNIYEDTIRTALWVWHQNIIRKSLLPYVTPVLWEGTQGIPPLPDKIRVVFLGNEIHDNEWWKSIQETIYDRLESDSLIISMKNNDIVCSFCIQSNICQHGDLQYWWLRNPVNQKKV